ncbi:MAG: type II secretion system F family protein [Nocardioidaceae bacterium]
MRRLLALAVGAAALAVFTSPAHAAGRGSIEHVEAAADGEVAMLFSVPGQGSARAPDPASVVVEVDDRRVDARVSPVRHGEIERNVVLALDVSQSMRGQRFVAAKQSAMTYLRHAPTDVSVGLLTFADSVTVVSSPTRDHQALADDIGRLALAKGTRLYDGVLEAITQAGDVGSRQVVVLSDGADTTRTSLRDVITRAEESGTTVNVVSLQQSRADEARLRRITDATGGRVLPADDSSALRSVFAAEADALANQVQVEFTSPTSGETTVAVSLEVDGQTYRDTTFTRLDTPVEPAAQVQGPAPARSKAPVLAVDDQLMYVGVGAIGLALAVVVIAVFGGGRKARQSMTEQHLAHYAAGVRQQGSGTSHTRGQVSIRDSVVSVAERVVRKGDFETRLAAKLGASGITLTPAEWLLMHAGVAVVASLVGLLLTGGPVGIIVFLLVGAAAPWLYLALKRSRRVRAFNSQLADTLQLMAGGLSAGLSLPQSVDTVVREGAEPMAGELRRALVEQRLGVEIEDALEGVGDRMESKDFAWVVMAIRIQREVGGNLAELLNTVSVTLRERDYLRRQVMTLSAEGRLSAWILGGLPPVFVAYLAMARPEYLRPLVTTPVGWAMSGMAVLMLTVGAFWLAKTVKVEV